MKLSLVGNVTFQKCRKFSDLPVNARRYVLRIEELLGVPIRWIGVGAGRLDMIDRLTDVDYPSV